VLAVGKGRGDARVSPRSRFAPKLEVGVAPARGLILSQESIHTTLSITHHTRKQPTTSPRTIQALNLPLDECIDNTHILVTKEKRKRKETTKRKLQQVIATQRKGKVQDYLKKTSLGPLRQGQRLNTTETKTCSSKEHKPPNQI
jgi:hypothetical protein